MIISHLVFGFGGAVTLGLVLRSIQVGSYPARYGRVNRSVRPVKFWLVMSASMLMGLIFLLFACFAQVKSTPPVLKSGRPISGMSKFSKHHQQRGRGNGRSGKSSRRPGEARSRTKWHFTASPMHDHGKRGPNSLALTVRNGRRLRAARRG